ncbi:hypothetical protein [Myroides odoratus]|uniref:hypothetical protein n=1 Tax=Myroides odoratus TaxID=256 RepID=UPI0039AF9B0F
MTQFLKNYKIGMILFLSVAINIYLVTQIYHTKTEVAAIKKNVEDLSEQNIPELNDAIFVSNFKDNLVLNSFNTSITIIITFFTVLIALGAVFSFKRVDDDIEKLKESTTKIETISKDVEKTKSKIEENLLENQKVSKKISAFQNKYFFSKTASIIRDTYKNRDLVIIYFITNKNNSIDTYIIHKSIYSIIDNLAKILELHHDYNQKNQQFGDQHIKDLTNITERVLIDLNEFLTRNINITPDNGFLLYINFKKFKESTDMFHQKSFTLGNIDTIFSNTLSILDNIQNSKAK